MSRAYPKRVTVYEVGPRDGLQNEAKAISTEVKIRYIEMLTEAGFTAIEATAFVSPRAVPQLADAGDVFRGIMRKAGVRYPVLVPNAQGMNRAIEAGAQEVALFTAASESFTKANIQATIAESLGRFEVVAALAKENGIALRGYVSTAFGCPYEGRVSEKTVQEVTGRLFDLGADEVSIGDTIGVATPGDVARVMGPLIAQFPVEKLAVHFHDTRGTALANVLEALSMGIATVDSSSAGLGGCPYAPGASGNLATEDLLYMLDGMGIETGISIDKVVEASRFITGALEREAASKYVQAANARATG